MNITSCYLRSESVCLRALDHGHGQQRRSVCSKTREVFSLIKEEKSSKHSHLVGPILFHALVPPTVTSGVFWRIRATHCWDHVQRSRFLTHCSYTCLSLVTRFPRQLQAVGPHKTFNILRKRQQRWCNIRSGTRIIDLNLNTSWRAPHSIIHALYHTLFFFKFTTKCNQMAMSSCILITGFLFNNLNFFCLVPVIVTDDVQTTTSPQDEQHTNTSLVRSNRGTERDQRAIQQYPTYYLAHSYTDEAGERRYVLHFSFGLF